MTGLIVDDEPLARRHLRRLLESQDVKVIGEAEDAPTALARSEDLHPDVLFLDIKMPGLSGMHMAAALLQIDFPPLIVFVTGYAEFAVAAFEQDAVDYVLKPVSAERLARTLVRLRGRLAARRMATPAFREAEARRMADQAAAVEAIRLQRLPVRTDYAVRLVRVEDIRRIQAREKRVYVRMQDDEEHTTYYTLTQLENLLPDDLFLRVHDSHIVNLSEVEELLFLGNHTYQIRLNGGACIPVGRTRYAELRRRLGLDDSGLLL